MPRSYAALKFGADDEYRPHNLLITKQVLCRLSYISVVGPGQAPGFGRTAGSVSTVVDDTAPVSHTIRIVKEQ